MNTAMISPFRQEYDLHDNRVHGYCNSFNEQRGKYQKQQNPNNHEYDFSESKLVSYPGGFQPRNVDVIIGKGMGSYHHIGNEMFRNIIASRIEDYAITKCKKEKSEIVQSIMSQVRNNGGEFIKKNTETGQWFNSETNLVRNKISQSFRKTLLGGDKIKNKKNRKENKQIRINKKRKQQKQQKVSVDTQYSLVQILSPNIKSREQQQQQQLNDITINITFNRNFFDTIKLPLIDQIESIKNDDDTSITSIDLDSLSDNSEAYDFSEPYYSSLFPDLGVDDHNVEHNDYPFKPESRSSLYTTI